MIAACKTATRDRPGVSYLCPFCCSDEGQDWRPSGTSRDSTEFHRRNRLSGKVECIFVFRGSPYVAKQKEEIERKSEKSGAIRPRVISTFLWIFHFAFASVAENSSPFGCDYLSGLTTNSTLTLFSARLKSSQIVGSNHLYALVVILFFISFIGLQPKGYGETRALADARRGDKRNRDPKMAAFGVFQWRRNGGFRIFKLHEE